MGYVFQEYALFPHLSVERNVAFGGRARPDLMDRFGIADLARAKPADLSGGEGSESRSRGRLPETPRCSCSTSRSRPSTSTREAGCAVSSASICGTLACRRSSSRTTSRTPPLSPSRSGFSSRARSCQTGTATELIAAPTISFVAEFAGSNHPERNRRVPPATGSPRSFSTTDVLPLERPGHRPGRRS